MATISALGSVAVSPANEGQMAVILAMFVCVSPNVDLPTLLPSKEKRVAWVKSVEAGPVVFKMPSNFSKKKFDAHHIRTNHALAATINILLGHVVGDFPQDVGVLDPILVSICMKYNEAYNAHLKTLLGSDDGMPILQRFPELCKSSETVMDLIQSNVEKTMKDIYDNNRE